MTRRAIIRRHLAKLKSKRLAAKRLGRGAEGYRAKRAADVLRALMG